MVPDIDGTQKFRWLTTPDWWQWLELIDSEIEKITDPSMAEAAIMRIRRGARTQRVWECSNCDRLLTFCDGELVILSKTTYED
jgi:hypothetical protein